MLRRRDSAAVSYTSRMRGKSKAETRIVSLAPSATSILCALGAKRLLVGVTRWCAEVAPVGDLPKLGDCWHMQGVEEITALRPTLVIGSVPYKQETVAKLLALPVSFLAMNPRTLADIERDISMLGNLVGKTVEAGRTVRSMRAEFARLRKRAGVLRSLVRVYCEAWPNPRISSPPWVAELAQFCGGKMVVPPGQTVSDEQVAQARPDVIVLAWAATGEKADPQQAYKTSAWKDMPAIRNCRVHVISDELLNTPGPPLVRGAVALWNALHSGDNRK